MLIKYQHETHWKKTFWRHTVILKSGSLLYYLRIPIVHCFPLYNVQTGSAVTVAVCHAHWHVDLPGHYLWYWWSAVPYYTWSWIFYEENIKANLTWYSCYIVNAYVSSWLIQDADICTDSKWKRAQNKAALNMQQIFILEQVA